MPKYDWYGYYGHQRSVSRYEQVMKEDYAKWSYAPYISDAIRNEVKECRENVALFDLSSFGKVRKSHILRAKSCISQYRDKVLYLH